MEWDKTIKATDVAIVIATLLGPILAIQVQEFLERRRASRGRQSTIFHALMRTRGTPLAPDAVNALNAIPLEFYGQKKITDAYKAFIDHINSAQLNPQAWAERRVDLLMDLIHKIAAKLGYGFDVAQLKAEFYNPQGHRTVDGEQNAIREGLAKILSGHAAFPMEVTKFPGDPEAQAALKSVLKGETSISVKAGNA